MSVQSVLLPVFVLVAMMFVLIAMTAVERTRVLKSGKTRIKDIALGEPNWPVRATQIANCMRNQFEVPVLFFALVAIALPLRQTDLVFVLLSWVFVLTRLVHAGIFVTTNSVMKRGMAWLAGVLVLALMWVYVGGRLLLAL